MKEIVSVLIMTIVCTVFIAGGMYALFTIYEQNRNETDLGPSDAGEADGEGVQEGKE